MWTIWIFFLKPLLLFTFGNYLLISNGLVVFCFHSSHCTYRITRVLQNHRRPAKTPSTWAVAAGYFCVSKKHLQPRNLPEINISAMTHSTPPFSLTAVCYESFNRWLSRCLHFVFRISRCLHFVRHTLSVCVDFRFAFGLYHERAPPRHHHQNPRDGASCPRLPGWAFCLF